MNYNPRNRAFYTFLAVLAGSCTDKRHPVEGEDYIKFPSQREKVPQKNRRYQDIDYSNRTLKDRIADGRFEEGFLSGLEGMCERIDMDCMGLLSVIDFETGSSYSPSKRNPAGSATGLIQFTSATARGLDTSTRALADMSQTDQLLYVEKYFLDVKTHHPEADFSDPKDIALAVFYPSAIGEPSQVIGREQIKCRKVKQSRKKRAKKVCHNVKNTYWQNRGLDRDDDGIITGREYIAPALERGFIDYN